MSQKTVELKQFLAKIDTPFYRKALINCKRAEGSSDEQKKLAEAIDEVVPIVHGVLSEIGKSRSANEVLQTEIKAIREENLTLIDDKEKCLNLNTSLFKENETLLTSLSEMLNLVESLKLEHLLHKSMKSEKLKKPEKSVKSVPANNEHKKVALKKPEEIKNVERTEKVEEIEVIKKVQGENVNSPCLEDGELAATPVPSPSVIKADHIIPEFVNEKTEETVIENFQAQSNSEIPIPEVKSNVENNNNTLAINSCDNTKASNSEEFVNISDADSDDGFDGFRKRIHSNKSEEDNSSDFCEIIEQEKSIPSPSPKMKRKAKDSPSPFNSIKKKPNPNGSIKRSARIEAKGSKIEQPRGHIHPAQILSLDKRRPSFQNSPAR